MILALNGFNEASNGTCIFFVSTEMLRRGSSSLWLPPPLSRLLSCTQGSPTVNVLAGSFPISFCALRLCICSSCPSLQKDRRRQVPQTRRLATSLRAVTGPPHLESDLAQGGWKRHLLSPPGKGVLALAQQPLLSPVFQASKVRLRHPQRPSPRVPTPTGSTLPPPHRAQVHL